MKTLLILLLSVSFFSSRAQVKKPTPEQFQAFADGKRNSLSITYRHELSDEYQLSIAPLKGFANLKYKVTAEYFDKNKTLEGMEIFCAPWQDVKNPGAVPFSFKRDKNFKRTNFIHITIEYYRP